MIGLERRLARLVGVLGGSGVGLAELSFVVAELAPSAVQTTDHLFLPLVLVEEDVHGIVAAVGEGIMDESTVTGEGVEVVTKLAFDRVLTGLVDIGLFPE